MKTRINVVGTSAGGKSTFSRRLAQRLGVDYIEMDALFWGPNWSQATDEEFFQRIEQRTIGKTGWVLDGNYTRTIPVKWREVEQVIWIDMPFTLNLYHSVRRALFRVISGKELWPGTNNRETWRELFSHKSIVWWMIKAHSANRRKYEQILVNCDYDHIEFVRLRSRREIEAFIESIPAISTIE